MKSWLERAGEREKLVALFAAAFVIRAASYWVLRGFLGFDFFHPDSAYYDLRAQTLVQQGAPGDWWSAALYEGFTFVAAVVYAVFGPAFQIVEILNLIVGALLPVVAYVLTRSIWTEKAGWGAALLAAVDPMHVYWSAHFLKDPWIVLLGFLGVYASLAARWKAPWRAVIAIALLLLLSSFRAHLTVGMSAALAIVFAFRKEWIGLVGCSAVTALILVRIQGGVPEVETPPGANRAISEQSPTALVPINRWRISSDVRSHVEFFPGALPKAPFENWPDFILFLIKSPIYLLMAPFPWQASNRFEAMFAAAMLWWYVVLGFAAFGTWKSWQTRQTRELIWMVAALGIPLTLMITTAGPFVRWRALPFSLLIPIAGYSLSLIASHWRRREERRGQASDSGISPLSGQLDDQVDRGQDTKE